MTKPNIRNCCPTHCCPNCGCKYGHKDCPVANGEVKPVYGETNGCEFCSDEEQIEINALRQENEDLKGRVEVLTDAALTAKDFLVATEQAPATVEMLKEALSLPTLGASQRLRDKVGLENEELKERIAEFESELANSVDGGASCRMHERALRDKHYRECAEIVGSIRGECLAVVDDALDMAIEAIDRAREEGR